MSAHSIDDQYIRDFFGIGDVFTGESFSVGTLIGCSPDALLRLRIPYSLIFSAIAFVLYAAAGLIF